MAAYLKPNETEEESKREYDIPNDTTVWLDQRTGQTGETAKQPTPAAEQTHL